MGLNGLRSGSRTMTKHFTKRSRCAWTPDDIAQLAEHKVPEGHTYSSARSKAFKLGIPFRPNRRHAVPSPVPQLGSVTHSMWTNPEIKMLYKGELPQGRSLASAYQKAHKLHIPFKRLRTQKNRGISESVAPTPEQSHATESLCSKPQAVQLVVNLKDGTTLTGMLERFTVHIPAQTSISDITREIPKVTWMHTIRSNILGELDIDARHITRVGTGFHCLIETPCPDAVARHVNAFLQL